MREQLLGIIEKNSRVDIKELAIIMGAPEIEIANELLANPNMETYKVEILNEQSEGAN